MIEAYHATHATQHVNILWSIFRMGIQPVMTGGGYGHLGLAALPSVELVLESGQERGGAGAHMITMAQSVARTLMTVKN